MSRVLVTGGKGQLASAIQKLCPDFVFVPSNELDITNPNQLNLFFEHNKFDLVINCAAFTDVEAAEDHSADAYKVNSEGVNMLLNQIEKHNLGLIHVSTDFVFDGKKTEPYTEEDRTNPLNEYGRSKLSGEDLIFERNLPRTVIIRTSWLFGGKNDFVSKILKLSKSNSELNIVSDQLGCPTYTHDLAKVLVELLGRMSEIESPELFHYSNGGFGTWFEFAQEFLKVTKWQGSLKPISSEKFGAKTNRPAYSVLNSDKISKFLNIEPREWRLALNEHLNENNR